MAKYKVEYQFEGCGYQIITAENETEAKDKFYEGEFEDDIDTSDNYSIECIKKIEEEDDEMTLGAMDRF